MNGSFENPRQFDRSWSRKIGNCSEGQTPRIPFWLRDTLLVVHKRRPLPSWIKVKPGQALRVPGGWNSQISRQSAHEGGKFVSPMHRPPLPPGYILGTNFCYKLSRPQCHSAAGRIMSKKNSNYTIGNRTRGLPNCSAVHQPTAPTVFCRIHGRNMNRQR